MPIKGTDTGAIKVLEMKVLASLVLGSLIVAAYGMVRLEVGPLPTLGALG